MISRRSTRVAIVGAALLAASAAARAQVPHIYCPPGAASCFAMKTAFSPYVGQFPGWYATTFTVWIQNLEGSYPSQPGGAFYSPKTFWIGRDNGPPEGPNGLPDIWLLAGADGNSSDATRPFALAEGNAQQGLENGVDRISNANESLTSELFVLGFNGIAGCTIATDPSVPAELFFSVRTCPAQGLNGWARMDFWLGLQDGFDPNEGPYEVDPDNFLFGIGGEFQANACVFGGDQAFPNPPHHGCAPLPYVLPSLGTTTPEPATLALVATGLVGVFGWRRRKA